MRIVIVDDNPDILESMSMYLTSQKHKVITIQEHEELFAARLDEVDVILQDIQMPNLDITKQLDKIAKDDYLHDVPVLLFTAYPKVPAATHPAVVGVISKPIDISKIEEQLMTAVRQTKTKTN